MTPTRAKVCVIGSGVAGGVISRELLDAGVRDIVMLEAGPRLKMRDQRMWYDFATASNPSDPFADRVYTKGELKNDGTAPFNEPWPFAMRGRGGSTMHWEGWAFRLKPEDFRRRSNIQHFT